MILSRPVTGVLSAEPRPSFAACFRTARRYSLEMDRITSGRFHSFSFLFSTSRAIFRPTRCLASFVTLSSKDMPVLLLILADPPSIAFPKCCFRATTSFCTIRGYSAFTISWNASSSVAIHCSARTRTSLLNLSGSTPWKASFPISVHSRGAGLGAGPARDPRPPSCGAGLGRGAVLEHQEGLPGDPSRQEHHDDDGEGHRECVRQASVRHRRRSFHHGHRWGGGGPLRGQVCCSEDPGEPRHLEEANRGNWEETWGAEAQWGGSASSIHINVDADPLRTYLIEIHEGKAKVRKRYQTQCEYNDADLKFPKPGDKMRGEYGYL